MLVEMLGLLLVLFALGILVFWQFSASRSATGSFAICRLSCDWPERLVRSSLGTG